MRKLMRKKVTRAAKLPHRTTCICPLLSMLPDGPMAGAGSGTSWRVRQSFTGGDMGAECLVLLRRDHCVLNSCSGPVAESCN